ncbi:hypothetical protein B0H14DRAFT_1011697 [Mycena olivaceomarginata]|nr:hypothetical protein B0H14DRAFT_1011697 [Mycena olivaceomarginata]
MDAPPSSPPPAPTTRSRWRAVAIAGTCTAAMLVNSSNNTSVAIALPTIGGALHTRAAALQWLVSAYPLSSGCLLLFCGHLADVHGRKRVFIGGSLILFAFTPRVRLRAGRGHARGAEGPAGRGRCRNNSGCTGDSRTRVPAILRPRARRRVLILLRRCASRRRAGYGPRRPRNTALQIHLARTVLSLRRHRIRHSPRRCPRHPA